MYVQVYSNGNDFVLWTTKFGPYNYVHQLSLGLRKDDRTALQHTKKRHSVVLDTILVLGTRQVPLEECGFRSMHSETENK